jgi:hypothetical protein
MVDFCLQFLQVFQQLFHVSTPKYNNAILADDGHRWRGLREQTRNKLLRVKLCEVVQTFARADKAHRQL